MWRGVFSDFADSLDNFYSHDAFLPMSVILTIVTTVFGGVAWLAPDAPGILRYLLPAHTGLAALCFPFLLVRGSKDWRKLDQLSNLECARYLGRASLTSYVSAPGLLVFGAIRGFAEVVGLCGRKTVTGLKKVVPEPGPQVTGPSRDDKALSGDVLEKCEVCDEVHVDGYCPWVEMQEGL